MNTIRTICAVLALSLVCFAQQPNSPEARLLTYYTLPGPTFVISQPCSPLTLAPECLPVPAAATGVALQLTSILAPFNYQIWASSFGPKVCDYITANGQCVDLDTATMTNVYSGTLLAGGGLGIGFGTIGIPLGSFDITLQAVVFDSSHPDGFHLSGAVYSVK